MKRNPAIPFVVSRARLRRAERDDTLRHERYAFVLTSVPFLSLVYLALFGERKFSDDEFLRILDYLVFWPVATGFCVGVLLVPSWFRHLLRVLGRLRTFRARRARDALELRMEDELTRTGCVVLHEGAAPLQAVVASEWANADEELELRVGALVVVGGPTAPTCPRCGAGLQWDSSTLLRCGYCQYERVESLAASPRLPAGPLHFVDYFRQIAPRSRRLIQVGLGAWLVAGLCSPWLPSLQKANPDNRVVAAAAVVLFVCALGGPIMLGYVAHAALRAYAGFGHAAASRLAAVRAALTVLVERQGVIAFAAGAAQLGVELRDVRFAIASARGFELPFHVHEPRQILLHAAYADLEADCANCGDRRTAVRLEEPCRSCRFRPPKVVSELFKV